MPVLRWAEWQMHADSLQHIANTSGGLTIHPFCTLLHTRRASKKYVFMKKEKLSVVSLRLRSKSNYPTLFFSFSLLFSSVWIRFVFRCCLYAHKKMWNFWSQQKNTTMKIKLRRLRWHPMLFNQLRINTTYFRNRKLEATNILRIRVSWHFPVRNANGVPVQHRQLYRSTRFTSHQSRCIHLFIFRFCFLCNHKLASVCTHVLTKKRNSIPEQGEYQANRW